VVDGGGLENHCTRKGTGGSNPSLSASLSKLRNIQGIFGRSRVADLLGGIPGCHFVRTFSCASHEAGVLSVGLWVAIDADTKIVPSVMLGSRNSADAAEFIADLASRLRHRVQLTSDGHRPYLEAVEAAFGADIDYAMLVKLYGHDQENERRYSPAQCIGAIPTVITGRPDPAHISTSYVERQNWSVRTSMRRYTRLSNGFSRKIENHIAAVAINYFAYNFIKIHRTLRVSPAMAAGVTSRLFDVTS
jgi:IS1 family transposase